MKTLREIKKEQTINALEEAQKIAFTPLTFQAIGAMLEFGILKEIDNKAQSFKELVQKTNIGEYALKTLLETALAINVINFKNELYEITKLGEMFLYDDMTRINYNFVKDVCYIGADELISSFKEEKPKGLNKFFKNAATIYPYLTELPDKMKKSWYEFDHYYSDNCFELIYDIISKNSNKTIFDIGANTGLFEKVCLKNNPDIDITMIDLSENIDFAKKDEKLKSCKFYKADVLKDSLPPMSGNILMSQFLDCFSKEQIILILKKVYKHSDNDVKVYILEPFVDNQRFKGANYALVHTSLYFTCMANGCSKMYSKSDMENYITRAGFKISNVYSSVGAHDYTLLECTKNV